MKETLAFQILVLYKDFLAYTKKELRNSGLSFGQMPFIVYTGKHPGCTQADLTKGLDLDWGYSQRSVSRLVDSGFMTKEYDSERSCNCLDLTGSGKKVFDLSHKVFGSWDRIIMNDMADEDKKTVIALLGEITDKKG